jgi:hypothetical protein
LASAARGTKKRYPEGDPSPGQATNEAADPHH